MDSYYCFVVVNHLYHQLGIPFEFQNKEKLLVLKLKQKSCDQNSHSWSNDVMKNSYFFLYLILTIIAVKHHNHLYHQRRYPFVLWIVVEMFLLERKRKVFRI